MVPADEHAPTRREALDVALGQLARQRIALAPVVAALRRAETAAAFHRLHGRVRLDGRRLEAERAEIRADLIAAIARLRGWHQTYVRPWRTKFVAAMEEIEGALTGARPAPAFPPDPFLQMSWAPSRLFARAPRRGPRRRDHVATARAELRQFGVSVRTTSHLLHAVGVTTPPLPK